MDLSSLNLSSVEEKILGVVINNQDILAKTIIERVDHDKKVVYDNLDKLQRKGLLTSVVRERARRYSFAGADAIRSFFREELRLLNTRKHNSESLINDIEKITPFQQERSCTELLLGAKSIRQFLLHLIEATKEYVVIGAPSESLDVLGSTFWHNFHARQEENGVNARMIFNASLKRQWPISNPNLDVRYFTVEPLTETIIFNDTVAILVWTPDPSATIIQNKSVAQSYKHFFELLWKQAKK